MVNWITFEEGEYLAERAALFVPNQNAIGLEEIVVTVTENADGIRQMTGRCRIRNILLVDMMEEHDRIDLALDMGGTFKFFIEDPLIRAGKVFSPDVTSSIQFIPQSPGRRVPESEFETFWGGLLFQGGHDPML
jgi:hypothetical protein